jgi:malate dehydrogenase (oxaloacetate-decarboxylating)(NADP+)
VHSERTDLSSYKQEFARPTKHRTLADALTGADVFIGVSAANLLTPELLQRMASRPIVFGLANPDPEIRPEVAHAARQDLIIATGRSDYPNQINNVLGFPFIFRGALDVRARRIDRSMCIAAVRALAQLAREPVPAEVMRAYHLDHLEFGPDCIVPKPLDPRLLAVIPPAVAHAAIAAGLARGAYPAHYAKYGT